MKASVITLVLSDNYGAALQSCAFAHALKQCGAEPTFYRYQDWSRITYGMSKAAHAKHFVFNCIKACLTQGVRQKRFDAFRESFIPMTKRLYGNNSQLRQEPGDYDVYISGSDQIWNPKLFIFDYSYFLDFAPEGAKRISYASSFGSAGFDPAYKEKCGKLLDSFSHISVRENSGKAIVSHICGKEAAVCLDPTLLLNKEDWAPMMENASKQAKNFNGILCYHMPGDGLVQSAIESLARQLQEKTGLPIMRLGIKEHQSLRYPKGETDIKAGPAEFLAYFAGAKYVVTNSFHGTAFAMNFGKECYNPINDTLPPEKALHERIVSFLTQLEATAQMIPASNPVLPEQYGVDQEKSQQHLSRLREESLAYLKNALEA